MQHGIDENSWRYLRRTRAYLLLKQQLIVLRRARKRAPNLSPSDRLLWGFWSLFLSPGRIRKAAIRRVHVENRVEGAHLPSQFRE